jgi:hypothetical protein
MSSARKTSLRSFPTITPSMYVLHTLSHNMRAQLNCQKFVSSIQHWEKIIHTSPAQSVFELQQALVVNKEFSMGGEDPGPSTTDMTTASAGDLSNLLMMYRLVEVLAITSGKMGRKLVPRHSRIPGLSDPKKFKVVHFNSSELLRVGHLASI